MGGTRVLAFLWLLGLTPARAEAPRRATEERRPFRGIRCLSSDGVLPAVTNLHSFDDGARVQLRCPEPRVAVIAGAFNDEESARRLLTELRGRELPFGYPVVAHPDALWLGGPRRKIVV